MSDQDYSMYQTIPNTKPVEKQEKNPNRVAAGLKSKHSLEVNGKINPNYIRALEIQLGSQKEKIKEHEMHINLLTKKLNMLILDLERLRKNNK